MSFASGEAKTGERGELPRITERVACVKKRKGFVNLVSAHSWLGVGGLLCDKADAPKRLHSAKDIADLMSKVHAPEGATQLDKDRVREWAKNYVCEAVTVEFDRRNAILKRARTIGGLLWTDAFLPEEIISDASNGDDLPDDDDPGISLVSAYRINGGESDNHFNGLDKGVIDAMATGAMEPWRSIPEGHKPSTGESFGAVIDDDENPLNPVSKRKAVIKPYAEFCAEYKPIHYLVDGLIQSGSLYTLTARTGGGKTIVLTSIAIAVAAGRNDILGIEVNKAAVVYCTYENPGDFRLKLIAAARAHGVTDSELVDLYVVDLNLKPEKLCKELRQMPHGLIVIDTLAAAFDGDDSNSNTQTGEFMRRLRPICVGPGKPAVIVAAHPIKNAHKDNLIPYGGGAVLNEVDGNFALWRAEGGATTELSWQGKFRGLEFEPVTFTIAQEVCRDLLDSKGRPVTSPVVRHLPAGAAAASVEIAAKRSFEEQMTLLRAMLANEAGTLREWGSSVDKDATGARRRLEKMEKGGLVEKLADKWLVTAKGKRAVAPREAGAAATQRAFAAPIDEAA